MGLVKSHAKRVRTVLVVLPITVGVPRRAAGSAKRPPDVVEEHELEPTSFALWNGITELLALIKLIQTLLKGSNKRALEMLDWLREVEAALAEMGDAVREGEFEELSINIDHWALSSLDAALDNRPALVRSKALFPTSMLTYWSEEVHRRGWELIHIAMGSISAMDSCKIHSALANFRYPIR